jgi:hypothetical protein
MPVKADETYPSGVTTMGIPKILTRITAFLKCSQRHDWNPEGVCNRCGIDCPHPAWIAKPIEEVNSQNGRVTVCMDCGMIAKDHRNSPR